LSREDAPGYLSSRADRRQTVYHSRMPLALKAKFIVAAGVIPGEPIPDLCKSWEYTSEDHQRDLDQQRAPILDTDFVLDLRAPSKFEKTTTRFTQMHLEAMRYYSGLIDPRGNNWATLQWIWY